MTLSEAGEIFAYWVRDPPAHLIAQAIARMLGWTPQLPSTAPARAEEIAAAAPPGLVMAPGGSLGMPAPALDPDTLREHNRTRAAEIARRGQERG